jgi:predicted RNase H-like nuclease
LVMSNQARGNGWVAGVDGCPAGWMVAFARVNEGEGSGELRLCVLPRFADILCADEAPAVIAVDIPIGLPAQAGCGGPRGTSMSAVRGKPEGDVAAR